MGVPAGVTAAPDWTKMSYPGKLEYDAVHQLFGLKNRIDLNGRLCRILHPVSKRPDKFAVEILVGVERVVASSENLHHVDGPEGLKLLAVAAPAADCVDAQMLFSVQIDTIYNPETPGLCVVDLQAAARRSQ